MSLTIRLRSLVWFATGIALTLALVLVLVVSQQFADATKSSGERPVFVPITPCRLVDTRPAPATIGGKKTPLGPGATMTIVGRSPSGNCGGAIIPADATALTLNVTAVGATQQTNLRVYPAGAPLPLVSNLNPSPGAAPTPNAVTTDLSASGQFTVYNAAGSVNVVIDISGYFVDHNHDDRYDTKAQVTAKIGTASEAVVSPGTAHPAAFTPQALFYAIDEAVTTTQPGQLQIIKSVNVDLDCGTGVVLYYLVVDDVAVPSSLIASRTNVAAAMSGVTEGIVQPGAHVIGVRAQCAVLGDYLGSYSNVDASSTYVLVIP